MGRWWMLMSLALCLTLVERARAQESPVDSLAMARQYTAWLYAGSADSLAAHTAEEARSELSQEYGPMAAMIYDRAGFELQVIEETWKLRNGDCQYWRTGRFSNMEEPLMVRWVLDKEGRITGLGVNPLSQAPPVEAETCGPPDATEDSNG